MTDTQRAAFEAWWREQMGQDWPKAFDGTREDTASMTWEAACKWKAAQAADAGRGVHASDCAVHNAPAYPNGPCDCGLVATINAELVEALEACLAKGSRWHNCDPVVQQARAALSRAKEQKS